MKNRNDLTLKFKFAINKFKQILNLQFQFFDPSANMRKILGQVNAKFQQIVSDTVSIDEQYSAILSWCNKWDSNGDRFGLAKMKFIQFNEKEFQDHIVLQKKHQADLFTEIKKENEKKWHAHEKEQNTLNDLILKKQNEHQQLEKVAQSLMDVNFSANCSDEVYQAQVRKLKKISGQIEQLSAVHSLNLTTPEPCQYSVSVDEAMKDRVIVSLRSIIQSYEEKLANRGIWRRFLDWFSIKHHRQVAAIVNYHQKVKKETDVQYRFAAAQAWFHRHKHLGEDQSAFAQYCIRPFDQELEQARFELIACFQKKSQKEIDPLVPVHINSVQSHYERVSLLHKDLKSIHAKNLQLHSALKDAAKEISHIEEAGMFGFVRNKAAHVVNKIKGLFGFMSTPKTKSIDAAKQIVREFDQINPLTPLEKIDELSKKTKTIVKDPVAATIVKEGVDKVILDTLQYGGKTNNYCFMGTTQATQLVKQVGNDKQKAVFKKAKAKADEEAQQTYASWEENYVSELDKKIETGEINAQLNTWRTAMLNHSRAEGRKPNANSERVYTQEVKPAAKQAFLFHSKGNKKMEAFITRAVTAALAASQYDLKGKKMAHGLQALSWEQSDTLVRIYGTKQQIKHWDYEVLPRILTAHNGSLTFSLRK